MTGTIRPQLLRMAREASGMTQSEAAERLDMIQVSLSRLETGKRTPSPNETHALANLYGVTTELFETESREAAITAGDLHYRRKKGVRVSDVRTLEARTNIVRLGANRLLKLVDVEPVLDIPDLSIEHYSPTEAARETRRYWSLPIGPVLDLTETLELAGVVIVDEDFPAGGLDGVSMWSGPWPVMYLNRAAPPDRRRFTMAHELGHLILHRELYNEHSGEREADAFASEFLFPEEQIKPDLRRLTLRRALDLKLKWYASVAAIIVRAKDIGAVTEEEATRLHKQRSAKGWTRHEPYSELLPTEQPETLRRVAAVLKEVGHTSEELAEIMFMPRIDLHPAFSLEGYEDGRHLRPVR